LTIFLDNAGRIIFGNLLRPTLAMFDARILMLDWEKGSRRSRKDLYEDILMLYREDKES
jgi:hypothetical protein